MTSARPLVPWFLILILSGCSPRGEQKGPVLRYETKLLARTSGSCDSAGTPCVSIRFSYPAIAREGSSPASESLAAYIDREMFASLEDGERMLPFDTIASGLIEQYAGLQEEFSDYRLPWTLDRHCTVLLDTAGVISIRFEEESFLGGAHGLRIVRLSSVDASSGRRLRSTDFFKPGTEGEFARIAEREFRSARSVPDSQSLSDAGFWVEEGKFEPTENVAVGRTGLVLYYNPYEIAPYAVGPTEVHISFDHLKDLLRPGGVLADLTSSLP